MSQKEAAKLIIENLQMLEQARNLLEGELSEKFYIKNQIPRLLSGLFK